MIIGLMGMILLFLTYIQNSKKRLHLMAIFACLFLAMYAVILKDLIFSVINVILTLVNIKQYWKIRNDK